MTVPFEFDQIVVSFLNLNQMRKTI